MQLFNMAICGRQNVLDYSMQSISSGSDISVQASSQALLLSWDIELAPHREVDLWFHCPYSTQPVDESGKPLHEVVNLPEYHPVSRNYGPLTREEIQSYLREAEAFWRNILGRYELIVFAGQRMERRLLGCSSPSDTVRSAKRENTCHPYQLWCFHPRCSIHDLRFTCCGANRLCTAGYRVSPTASLGGASLPGRRHSRSHPMDNV